MMDYIHRQLWVSPIIQDIRSTYEVFIRKRKPYTMLSMQLKSMATVVKHFSGLGIVRGKKQNSLQNITLLTTQKKKSLLSLQMDISAVLLVPLAPFVFTMLIRSIFLFDKIELVNERHGQRDFLYFTDPIKKSVKILSSKNSMDLTSSNKQFWERQSKSSVIQILKSVISEMDIENYQHQNLQMEYL